jgi:radical SAM protein with 4Fe4S-binding SPASM domain
LLTEQRGLCLGIAGLDELRVSFDGSSPEENDTIRVNSHFYRHAEMVKKVAEQSIRPKKIVIYNARVGTDEPAPYLKEFFRDCPVVFRGEKMRTWARLNNDVIPPKRVSFCSNLFETFTILSDGNVVMCCEDLQADEIIGNVFDDDPITIWERMEERRRGFVIKEYPKLCKSCWVVTGAFVK